MPPWRGDRACASLTWPWSAEDVETADQLALLRSFGCDEAQGFLLGRPVAATELGGAMLQAA